MHAAKRRARTRPGPAGRRVSPLHLWISSVGLALAAVCALVLAPLASASAAPVIVSAPGAESASSLPACPFWDSGVTPLARTVSPWVPPLQTASAVNFTSRPAAPALTGTLANGEVTITVNPVPNAVAYRVWRDGVDVGYISYWGQTGPLTVTDTSPCQGAYYDVVAMYDTSGDDASMGQLSVPYWLGDDGTLATGAGDAAVGTQIPLMVTSYDNTGQTASGFNAQLGVCATDPRVIPWGTYFTIPGYGTCYAADIGTWIQNDTVDVWLPGSQANGWGVQDMTATIIADPYASGSGSTASASPTATATATATASSSPTATASASPTTTPTPTPPTGSGTCDAAWSATTSYTPGELVSYDGDNYTATYYSTDAVPDAATSWAVWSSDGACSS
jgi:3D (Asp-Asp-Asp) domain-containing protein